MRPNSKPTVIITGASSGVGLHATKAMVDRGWRVIMACRDLAKAKTTAAALNISPDSIALDWIDLGSQSSVRDFASRFKASGEPLHALACNAAVYLPLLKQPARSPEGYEISVATNHFGHFLLSHLLLPNLTPLNGHAPRILSIESKEFFIPLIPAKAGNPVWISPVDRKGAGQSETFNLTNLGPRFRGDERSKSGFEFHPRGPAKGR